MAAAAPIAPAAPTPPTPPEPLSAAPQDCSAVYGYDWDVRTAYAVCVAESQDIQHPTGNARQNNAGLNRDGSVDYGLMQINSVHRDMVDGNLESLYNPVVNIRIAYSLSKGGTDWTPWSAYNNGKYLKHL